MIEFTIKSTKKLLVKPPVTVGLSSCSAAFHDVSLCCDEAHRIETVTRRDDNFFPCFRARTDADADFLVFFTVSHCMLHFACSIVSTKKNERLYRFGTCCLFLMAFGVRSGDCWQPRHLCGATTGRRPKRRRIVTSRRRRTWRKGRRRRGETCVQGRGQG